MSWSATYLFEGSDIVHEVTPMAGQDSEEAQAAHQAAFDAASALIGTKTVGENKKFKVIVSGHANPGNVPVAGWSNDCLNISIYQLEETE